MTLQTIVQGYDGYAGIGIQATIGTGVAATVFQRITEASITYKEPNKKRVEHIQKKRNYVDMIRGGIEVSGSLSGFLTPDELFGGSAWAMLLGASNTVSGSASVGFTHVYNELGALPNVGHTIEIYKGGSAVMFDMIGMFLSKLALTFGGEEAITFASDWIGVSEAVAGTVSTATFNDDPPFESWMAKIEVGASLAATLTEIPLVQSATFSYDNKLEPLKGIGSRNMVGRKVGRPEISVDFGQLLQNSTTYYDYFKNNSTPAMKITLTHDSLAGTSSGVYSIVIELPKTSWLGDSPSLGGADAIEHANKVIALEETSAYNYAIKVTIVNSQSGTYTVTA